MFEYLIIRFTCGYEFYLGKLNEGVIEPSIVDKN